MTDKETPLARSEQLPVPAHRAAAELAQLLGVEATTLPLELSPEVLRAKVERYIAELPEYVRRPLKSGAESQLEYRQEEIQLLLSGPRDTLTKILELRHYFTRARAVAKIAGRLPAADDGQSRRQLAQQLMTHLEEIGSDLVYRRSYIDKKPVYRQNHQLVLKERFLDGVASLQQPLKTLKKAEQLLGLYWQSQLAYDNAPAHFDFLRQLEATPEAVVDQVTQQIGAVRGLGIDATGSTDNHFGELRQGSLPKDLQLLTEVFAAGGFSPEQQSVLDTINAIGRIMPEWFTSLPLARGIALKEHWTDTLLVASWVIGALDHAPATDHYRQEFKLDSWKLRQIVEVITSGKSWITPDYIRQLAQAQVALSPQDLLQLPDEDKLVEVVGTGTATSETVAEGNPPPSFQAVSSAEQQQMDLAGYQLYLRRRAAEQQRLLDSSRLPELRVLAAFFQQPLNTENMLFFAAALNSTEQLTSQLEGVPDQDRLELFAELRGGVSQNHLLRDEMERLSELYHLSDQQLASLRDYYRRTFRQPLFSRGGQLDVSLVERAYDEGYCQDEALLSYLPDPAQAFYRYAVTLPGGARVALKYLKDEFPTLCPDGRETPELVRRLCQGMHAHDMVEFLTKERLAVLHGKSVAEAFLSALPVKNDERRNAFTHNDYDRTSQLVLLLTDRVGFRVDQTDQLQTLTEYVRRFGLARSVEVYRLFQALVQHEQDQALPLPEVLRQSHIETVAALVREVKELRLAVMSERPLTGARLAELSPLQLELLEVITGKTSHRFDGGRPPFARILADYRQAETNQEIAPVATGYHTVRLELQNVIISFDPEPIRSDYDQLRTEVLDSIEQAGQTQDLVGQLRQVLQQKVENTSQSLADLPEKARPFAEKNLNGLRVMLARLTDAQLTLDQALAIALELELGKSEQSFVNSLKRRLVLRRVFERHFSPDFIQSLKADLSQEVTPRALLGLLNVVDELVKQHALNLGNQTEGAGSYWSAELLTQLRNTKAGKKLVEVFAGGRDKLKHAVEEFTVAESGGKTTIAAIPCRDFTGEMAGYIADVCYTKEYPLLKGRAVTPYKFVLEGETPADSELGGSVLVFEVTTSTGEDCLLVRGFDFPHESEVNIAQLIEGFLDALAAVARAEGKQKVLVPAINGAISNYQMTINHIRQEYIQPGKDVILAAPFIFNGYDLTQSCYVARQVS